MDPVVWSYIAVGAGAAALLLALFFGRQVLAAPPGNERMQELSSDIRDGAMAFLKQESLKVQYDRVKVRELTHS